MRSGSSLLPLGVLRSVGDSLLSGGWMILLYNALSPLIIIAIIVFGLSRKVRHALILAICRSMLLSLSLQVRK